MKLTNLQLQLNELKTIKGCLNHFLYTSACLPYKECKEFAEANLKTVKDSIALISRQILAEKAKIVTVMSATTRTTYQASKQEQEAIMHFNNNKKYGITE